MRAESSREVGKGGLWLGGSVPGGLLGKRRRGGNMLGRVPPASHSMSQFSILSHSELTPLTTLATLA